MLFLIPTKFYKAWCPKVEDGPGGNSTHDLNRELAQASDKILFKIL